MTKKLLFISDLDGTLLNNNFEISEFNKNAIKAVEEAGHVFCIATGRAWSEAEKIYNSAGIDTLCVTSNGSYVHSPKECGFKEMYSPIGKELANKIFAKKWMQENIEAFNAPAKKTVTFYKIPVELTGELQYEGLEIVKTDKCEVNDEIISIIIMADKDIDMDRFDKEMDEFKELVQWSQWSVLHNNEKCFIEINTLKCKRFGIQQLSEFYGIPQEDIITFGDQMNDYTMTKWSGLGIVMSNAHEDLKPHADIILDKNNLEDGVGHKMLEIIKGNK